MNNLPTELLHCVFIELFLIEKLNCMLVCKKWANIIRTRSLLHSVIIADEMALDKLMALLNRDPKLAFQVEELRLEGCPDGYFHRDRFPAIFPNLKLIIGPDANDLLFSEDPERILHQPVSCAANFKSQIRSIDDNHNGLLTRAFLEHGLCTRLTTLNLELNSEYESPGDLFTALKDVPALKTLTVTDALLSFDSLEMIHANIPSLKTLEIDCLDTFPSPIPNNIVPAFGLTKFVIESIENAQEMGSIFQYVGKKYINLRHFLFDIFGEPFCKIWKDVYGTELPPLLQKLGPRLESLQLNCNLDRNRKILKSLDNFGFHLKMLQLEMCQPGNALAILAKSRQFKLIEKFKLHNIADGKYLEALKGMGNLKELDLYFDFSDPRGDLECKPYDQIQKIRARLTCNLSNLFRILPKSVHTLSIEEAYIDYDENDKQTFNLKSLELSTVKPLKRIDTFISSCLPYLRRLSLEVGIFKYNTVFIFPNHHFSRLTLCDDDDSWRYNVSLVTSDRMKPRFYGESRTPFKDFDGLSGCHLPLPAEDLVNRELITLVCGSVTQLRIQFSEAYLDSDGIRNII